MNGTARNLLATLVLVAVTFLSALALVEHPSALTFEPLVFNPPETKRVVLKNGMVLHLLENHELPLVEISGIVRIGAVHASPEKAGLASLTGDVWRAGGTISLSPSALDERLEFIGAVLETGIGRDSGNVSLSVLKKDLDEGLALFADVLKNPAFDEKRFSVAKNNLLEGIRRQNDDPDSIADREFNKILLPGHPLSVYATRKTVETITRDDCLAFYRRYIGPASFIIGISGDFDPKDIVARFEKLFGDFKPEKERAGDIPPIPDTMDAGVYLVDKQLPQTVLRLGHIGVSRKNPDYYAVRVMNFIMGGGGFSSRLLQEVRSTRGLAYSIYSYFFGGERDKGTFMIGGETKAESTYEVITVSRDIMRRMMSGGVSDDELALAKGSIINSFVFGFDKDSKIVSRYLWLEFYDLPRDYLKTFRDHIAAVTRDDVQKAAKKYLFPDRMAMLAVGNKALIEKDLSLLGPVKEIRLEEE